MSDIEPYPLPISNPAELALSRSEIVMGTPVDIISPEEEAVLVELDSISEASGFHGQYFIEAKTAFAIPASFERGKQVSVIHFEDGLSFQGDLTTYGIIKVGSIAIGSSEVSVRALCLTFGSALLLPFFDNLEEDKLLYVPAHAVDDIRAS